MINELGDSQYGTIWMDVETNPAPGCSWANFSPASNCDYLRQLVDAVHANNKVPGIYASQYMWTQIMGSATAC